jgi:hypothetical protein
VHGLPDVLEHSLSEGLHVIINTGDVVEVHFELLLCLLLDHGVHIEGSEAFDLGTWEACRVEVVLRVVARAHLFDESRQR